MLSTELKHIFFLLIYVSETKGSLKKRITGNILEKKNTIITIDKVTPLYFLQINSNHFQTIKLLKQEQLYKALNIYRLKGRAWYCVCIKLM